MILERHLRELRRFAFRLSPTAADADDLVQQTLLAVVRGIGGFDGRATLMTWMCKILVREAARRDFKNRRIRARSREMALHASCATGNAHEAADSQLDVAEALPRLPADRREAIVLREMRGLSYAEIAATLGVPRGTVESRLHRARAELREILPAYIDRSTRTTQGNASRRSSKLPVRRTCSGDSAVPVSAAGDAHSTFERRDHRP